MLFNSSVFLLQFLPVAFFGFLLLSLLKSPRILAAFLVISSLIFYSWWNISHLPLLLCSMLFNYGMGGYLIRHRSRPLLIVAIAANILLLGYFKYLDFGVEIINFATDDDLSPLHIVLPLAISFFTFQQIAYLVDAYDGGLDEHDFLNYCLFITFFPHLIAGPITHHREMLPQFTDPDRFRPRWDAIALGSTLFFAGLFKKVIIADPLGATASPVFAAAERGPIQLIEAWGGGLAYTLQIYFDFSGYSDMAIGLGLLFGIALPINFDSPFKARNIIDFWSRWHMTLTRFLTAHIYNPIVMSITRARAQRRLPLPRRGRMTAGTFATVVAMPTIITMFVAGVWHGAGWQFVVFGLLHGFYLVAAHGWRAWKVHRGLPIESESPLRNGVAVLTTFLCVVVALIFFRASGVGPALHILGGMAGFAGTTLPHGVEGVPGLGALVAASATPVGELPLFSAQQGLRIAVGLAVVWTLPNAYQWLRGFQVALDRKPHPSGMQLRFPFVRWRPSPLVGAAVGSMATVTILYALSAAPTEFLYFQF